MQLLDELANLTRYKPFRRNIMAMIKISNESRLLAMDR